MERQGVCCMEKRENQRVMLTKRLMKESLTRLLEKESIHKISIRALCEEAGVNRSTFYKYYGSQYDVLQEMEEELIANVREALEKDGKTTEREMLMAVCACIEQDMPSVRVLLGNNVDPQFPEHLFSLPKIREMIEERFGDRYDAQQREYIYVFLVNGTYRLVQEWMLTDEKRPFSEIVFLLEKLIDSICGQ